MEYPVDDTRWETICILSYAANVMDHEMERTKTSRRSVM